MKVRNKTRRLFDVQFTHAVCDAVGRCSCTVMGARRVPGSLTILPGETKAIPDPAILLPEVDRALRNGDLVLVREVRAKAKAREREEKEQ